MGPTHGSHIQFSKFRNVGQEIYEVNFFYIIEGEWSLFGWVASPFLLKVDPGVTA